MAKNVRSVNREKFNIKILFKKFGDYGPYIISFLATFVFCSQSGKGEAEIQGQQSLWLSLGGKEE